MYACHDLWSGDFGEVQWPNFVQFLSCLRHFPFVVGHLSLQELPQCMDTCQVHEETRSNR